MNTEDMMHAVRDNEVERVRQIFAPYDIRKHPEKYGLDYPEGALRKASVLIPLFLKNGQWRVLLTLRSKDLTHHAGYVAFPGGMSDDTDTDEIHTALREAEEEIGLNPNDVEVLGVFCPGLVSPNSLVTQVLGIIPEDFVPKLNIREVSLVFDLPLGRFLNRDRFRVSTYRSDTGLTYNVHHFEDKIGDQIVDTWGFTAIYCVKVAVGVFQSDQEFNFMDQDKVTSKDNLFSVDGLITLFNRMRGTSAKL